MAKLIINEENKKSHIEPEIYGHFSEHLGRCIYEGIFVGEKMKIQMIPKVYFPQKRKRSLAEFQRKKVTKMFVSDCLPQRILLPLTAR